MELTLPQAYISNASLYIFLDNVTLIQIIDEPFGDASIQHVAFDRRLGGIAISSGNVVKIYEEHLEFVPETDAGIPSNDLNIRWTSTRSTEVKGTAVTSLSWGLGRELLVGNDHLALYHPSSSAYRHGELSRSWIFPLARSVQVAQFSPDASLIASYASADRLVKIWRRLSDRVTSSGVKTSDFDFNYLVHSARVKDVKWRQPLHEDLVVDNILYSTSLDGVLRVWASDIPHDSHILTLHESISLKNGDDQPHKIPCILDDDAFARAYGQAMKRASTEEQKQELRDLLSNIHDAQAEIALIFGFDGSMDAYALHNLGSRNHKASSQHLILKTKTRPLFDADREQSEVSITVDVQLGGLAELVFFIGNDKSVTVHECHLSTLFRGEPSKSAFKAILDLTGHGRPIRHLNRVSSGMLCSTDVSGNSLMWKSDDGDLRRTKYSGDVALTETQVDMPDFISAESVILSGQLGCYKAIVSSESPVQIQIWGSALLTSFTGAPMYRLTCNGPVKHLQWSLSEDNPFLVASTEQELHILVPSRDTESWKCVWSYDMHASTFTRISGLALVDDTSFAVSAGSCIFLFTDKDWQISISDTVKNARAARAVYDPVFLQQLLYTGNLSGARTILATLHDKIVSTGDCSELPADLGLTDDQLFQPVANHAQHKDMRRDYSAIFGRSEETNDSILSASKAASLHNLLKEVMLPSISSTDQVTITAFAIALALVEVKEQSLDRFGLLFYLSYCIKRQLVGSDSVIELSSEDIVWASRSTKQDILLDLVKSSVQSLTWKHARESKIFFWLKDDVAVRELAETIAKAEFLKDEDRDPVAASLWYFALQRKSTVLGLWRMSGAHPEHNLTTRILANDFEAPKWRTAANKNAFALIGRRRYAYSAAWFLLAGSVKDAVSVCVRNVQDVDLALAVARICEGQRGPILEDLLKTNILQLAQEKGDRFLAFRCQELLGDAQQALDVLTTPLSSAGSSDTPALFALYHSVRKTLGPSVREAELLQYIWDVLDRIGCKRVAQHMKELWSKTCAEDAMVSSVENTGVSLEDFKAAHTAKLVAAPQAVYEEVTMDSFAAFDF